MWTCCQYTCTRFNIIHGNCKFSPVLIFALYIIHGYCWTKLLLHLPIAYFCSALYEAPNHSANLQNKKLVISIDYRYFNCEGGCTREWCDFLLLYFYFWKYILDCDKERCCCCCKYSCYFSVYVFILDCFNTLYINLYQGEPFAFHNQNGYICKCEIIHHHCCKVPGKCLLLLSMYNFKISNAYNFLRLNVPFLQAWISIELLSVQHFIYLFTCDEFVTNKKILNAEDFLPTFWKKVLNIKNWYSVAWLQSRN